MEHSITALHSYLFNLAHYYLEITCIWYVDLSYMYCVSIFKVCRTYFAMEHFTRHMATHGLSTARAYTSVFQLTTPKHGCDHQNVGPDVQ